MNLFQKAVILKTIFMGFTLGIVGCQSGSNSEPKVQTQISQVQTSDKNTTNTLPSTLKIQIDKVADLRIDRSNLSEFKVNLNTYKMTISIPEEYFSGDLEIKYSPNKNDINPKYMDIDKNSAQFNGETFHIENLIKPWQPGDYSKKTVSFKVYLRQKLLGEFEKVLTPDLIISNDPAEGRIKAEKLELLPGSYNFGVLYFDRDVVFETNGAHLSITSDLLIAENASIESFSAIDANSIPEQGQVGKAGGQISLVTKIAIGYLDISMRGTRGGQGYDQRLIPDQSTKGGRGHASLVIRECEPSIVDNKNQTEWSSISSFRNCSLTCVQQPGNGLPGSPGKKGFPGEIGMSGGDSGSVNLMILTPSPQFTYKIQNIPGMGGPGGKGGPGGLGGLGGDPGDNSQGKCNSASSGPRGPQGLSGEPGAPGLPGKAESNTIQNPQAE